MPVKKFRSITEMKRGAYAVGSPELVAATRYIWDLSAAICPLRFPPGVYRHRTLADAELLRAQWARANAEAQRDRTRTPSTPR